MSQTTNAVIAELMDRRLLNNVDDDLHQEIAEAVIQAARLSRPDTAEARLREEAGWLIEKDEPPVYAILTDDYDEHWTSDASAALRFARRADAKAYSDHIGWTSPPVRIVEHLWTDGPPREVIATSNGHHWIKTFNLTCCRDCGIVRRADDKNKTCKGVVRVGPRKALSPPSGGDGQIVHAINGPFASALPPGGDEAKKSETRDWPHDEPAGWNLDAAKFLAVVQSQPMMWLALMRAKYIELRVDTRDGGFNLYDRDHKPLNPDEVVAAVKFVTEKYGSAPYRPSEPSPPADRREIVARIIDPGAFKSWQGMFDYSKDKDGEDFARRCADHFHKKDCDEAFAKADAILAALAQSEEKK